MNSICSNLHNWLNVLPLHKFPFDETKIPLNGIYFLFEKGQLGHGGNRVVRIGTHTGKDQLRSRVRQHFLVENKDRSIFRKNIGRAILNKKNDPFLEYWELDLTPKEAREKYAKSIDFNKQKEIENLVTRYLQDNFNFVVLQVDDKDKRLELESKIISTISLCKECFPSKNWLGLFSPKEKIRQSGLWLVNELYKEPLSELELEEIKRLHDL